MSVRDIDVVPIWQDLLSEDAVLSAAGMLEKFTLHSHASLSTFYNILYCILYLK